MESNKSDSDRKLSKSKKRLKKSINRKKINKVKLMTDHDDGRKDQYPKKGSAKSRKTRRYHLPPVDGLRSDGRSTSAGSSSGIDKDSSRLKVAINHQTDHEELCQLMKKNLQIIDDWLYSYINTTRDSVQINKETLRWEYENSNSLAEKNRLEIYKEKRRQRYLKALGKLD